MAEFKEVMRQARRMCAAHKNCYFNACPAYVHDGDGGCALSAESDVDIKEVENIVLNWATEHPEVVYPTWREWQNERFPENELCLYACHFAVCPYENECHGTPVSCYDKTIPADIAEILGISPKNTKEVPEE